GRRRNEHPVVGDNFHFLLANELREIQRLERRERARFVVVGERTPFDADIGERRNLGWTERRDLLRREQNDLVGLDLLRQPTALAAAHAVEPGVGEQRDVREQQEKYKRSHPRRSSVRERGEGQYALEDEIIHDLHGLGKVRCDVGCCAAGEKSL